MARSDTPSEGRGASDDFVERVTDAGSTPADAVGRAAAHAEQTREELLAQGAELSSNVQKVGKNFPRRSTSRSPISR